MPRLDAKDLAALARRLFEEGPVKTLATQRRVRIIHKGACIADTTKALYVWEHAAYPYFYLPGAAFDHKVLNFEVLESVKGEHGGAAQVMKMQVKGKPDSATDRVLSVADASGTKADALTGLMRIEFSAVDQWLEEDQPIFVHPKDPFKRLDLLPSTRRVRVTIPHPAGAGAPVVLADSPFAVHLFETSLPVRYYLPLAHADAALLRPSARGTRTLCPYKGEAEYYDVVLGDGSILPDLVWFYNRPNVECAGVAGMVCFYNEKVDVSVDGVVEERPKTWFA